MIKETKITISNRNEERKKKWEQNKKGHKDQIKSEFSENEKLPNSSFFFQPTQTTWDDSTEVKGVEKIKYTSLFYVNLVPLSS